MTAPYSPPAKPTALTRPSRSTVRCGSISIARSPTVTEPSGAIATTLGSNALPFSPTGITRGSPPSIAAIKLLVVPRSMPKIRAILSFFSIKSVSGGLCVLEGAIDVANQGAQIGNIRKSGLQFQCKHFLIGGLIPFREISIELGQRFIHFELKLD